MPLHMLFDIPIKNVLSGTFDYAIPGIFEEIAVREQRSWVPFSQAGLLADVVVLRPCLQI